ncbi:DUF3549 family protein [Litorilituus lipolyticus]|uniref:DUF3549 family protein n=1 Tax=Litorilituus lipolyticus TaxID=2491017 RepID=A0A502KRP4_9GAMM|nr:DUF3549 family protein [Litorilituus lipolyticus]TPH13844.1 DUF3549 family protein [Litorilituus lipolyticus]
MTNIETISQLLQLSGSQYRLFDMGRKIEKISKDLFEKIELNQLPYPTPSQGHAFIAIAFWQKMSPEPYLWLVKLPLDERGLLNQAARNHFIAIIVEALGSDLTKDPTEQQEELLKNNPYLFTPAQYKLASLNSKLKVELKQNASEYFSPFLQYISTESNWQEWQNVGVQGITDFVARINQDNHSKLLIKALPSLPEEVLLPICGALENENLTIDLIGALIAQLTTSLQSSNSNSQVSQYLLRSLSGNSEHVKVRAFIKGLLQQDAVAAELLITLSGRCWMSLSEPDVLMAFFEHLVITKDIALFNSIFKDLVAIPAIRPVVFQCMRADNRSQGLAQAIGNLFNQA